MTVIAVQPVERVAALIEAPNLQLQVIRRSFIALYNASMQADLPLFWAPYLDCSV